MLTGLRLGNFKPFATTQRLPIRPLTLIFGPNSSGTSSLIHGLTLARHALESGGLDVHRTTIGGEAVDLGGFRQYVHRRAGLRRVDWAAEIDAAQLQGRIAELLAPAARIMTSVEIGMDHVERTTSRTVFDARTGQFVLAEVPTGELVPSGPPQVQRHEIIVDGNSILRMSRRRDGGLQLDQLNHQHPVFRGVIKAIVETATTTEVLTTADYEGVEEAITTLVPDIRAQLGKFLPSGLLRSERSPVVDEQSIDSLGAEYFRTECEQRLPSIVPEGIQVHIVRWREKDAGEKLHNRYILTDIGGVSFGVGLDDSADGETDEVTLLEDKTYRFRRAQYMSPEPAFELVDELVIEGKRRLQPL
jgi:hypothetical protein